MCHICKYDVCPPACPSYEGLELERGRPIGRCEECGGYVYADEKFFEAGRFILCPECADLSI